MSTRFATALLLMACMSVWVRGAQGPTTAPARPADLGALRDEEQATRGQLREVEQQLGRLSQESAASATIPVQSKEDRQRRVAALNDLKTRYQFRVDELSRDLRERAVKLSIDGMGVPGRIGSRELELQELIKLQLELTRNAADAAHALDAVKAKVSNGEEPPLVGEQIERDPMVQAARKAVLDVENAPIPQGAELPEQMKKKVEAARKRLDDVVAETRAKATARLMESLKSQVDMTGAQVKAISEKIDNAKMDLGELTGSMEIYLRIKDEEKTTREMLRKVVDELEQLELAEKTAGDGAEQAKRREQDQLLARSTDLNNLRSKYQFRLDDLRRQIQEARAAQAAGMFAGTVDVYLSQEDVRNHTPSIAEASYAGTAELGGRDFVRLTNGAGTWSVDPEKIVAVRGSAAAK